MATLEALAISGIRSYNPERLERIDFTHPLTLINGKNGSGKTTIIQCLKYITTGVLPPSARTQKSFVMDPTIAGTAQVKGDIRLRFRTAKERVVIAKKVLMVSRNAKGLSSRAVQQSLKTKDQEGREIEVSQRCADIQRQIPQMLGISRPILDNIVFCHQDESLWPFSDNNTLKGIFDELFQTKRFTKTMQNMKQALKDYQKQRLLLKSQLSFLQKSYQAYIKASTQSIQGLSQAAEATMQFHKLTQQLPQIKQKLSQYTSTQNQKNSLVSVKGALEYQIEDCEERIGKLELRARGEGLELRKDEGQGQGDMGDKGETNLVDRDMKERVDVLGEIQRVEREIKVIGQFMQESKDKDSYNRTKHEIDIQLNRIKDIIPQLSQLYPRTIQQFLPKIDQKLKTLKSDNDKLSQIKEKLNKIAVPNTITEDQLKKLKAQVNSIDNATQNKKLQAQLLQKKIRYMYNQLYNPNLQIQGNQITAESRKAGERLSRLQAQIQMKKVQLKKYQDMKPRNKSLQQQFYQLRYTGIQLQKQMLQYSARRRQCGFCMKKLTDQDLQALKTKIQKTQKKSQERIEQLQRNYKPDTQIDPVPIVKQIEQFLQKSTRTLKMLEQQKQRYDKYTKCQHQMQINKQLNKLMAGLGLKSAKIDKSSKPQLPQLTLQSFRALINDYRLSISQYKSFLSQQIRLSQSFSSFSAQFSQYNELSVEKNHLVSLLPGLQNSTKNLTLIQHVWGKLKQLAILEKKEEEKRKKMEKERNQMSEESSEELNNQLENANRVLKKLKNRKAALQIRIQIGMLQIKKQEAKTKLTETTQKLSKITQTRTEYSDLQQKKNQIQLQAAKLTQKISIKRSLYSNLPQQIPVYLQKLLRYKTLNNLISDVQISVKAMERAINRLHNEKMDQINKIIFDIWQEVYHAKDIHYIRINSVAEKRNGYGYSIVMNANGQNLDMKGRCSMGQKVLASLIIRMALAESFSASTHILALDEPTTNLDRVHIENLAQSISSIINMQKQQNTPLQLLVISHDMEFIGLLKKHTNFYYEISRNQKNFSVIKKKQIGELGMEKGMDRIEAVHY